MTHAVLTGPKRTPRPLTPLRALPIGVALVAAITLIVMLATSDRPSTPKKSAAGLPVESIKINGESFETEIAATLATRAKGLGGRDTIGRNEAMAFVFKESAPQRFWMIDCSMDIDIVFLDRTGKILAAHEMKKEPPRGPNETQAEYEARLPYYNSNGDALYALEFAPGTLTRLGLKAGQTIPLDHGKLKTYVR